MPRVIPFMVRWLGSGTLRSGRGGFREGMGFGTVLNNFPFFVPCRSQNTEKLSVCTFLALQK
jgi:hypothetical protein